MANRKYFGTDGVRGKVGTYPITPDFALKLGWAAGKVLASQGSRTVLIGKILVFQVICWNLHLKQVWLQRV